ncbi:RiPP maturation radical SAM C-methyltransferase [Iningainema tapete]|uniref:RiPP maturation radical SAM protein 1 n=1 Tax=Iningainema tapete BLCC-T55 TaxID=2748662 RepID=A0A8J6XS65_9CYAN|nr:RiPP maturation radical SAM protein 1 [Iningainema tapete BLCC-T55]
MLDNTFQLESLGVERNPVSSRNRVSVAASWNKTEVLLISMPFGPLFLPSIGLGLLKAGLTSRSIHAKILYLTLKFASLIGISLYEQISKGRPAIYDLLGEWLFSGALFDSTNVEGYINDVLRGREPAHLEAHKDWAKPIAEDFIQEVLAIRDKVEGFLDECVEEVVAYQPKIIAFTSVFQQHSAANSLAKRIKQRVPETFIILGGANCEGIMGAEVIRQFPFVDATISGEGDIVFPELVERILAQKSISDLQGVFTHDNIEYLSQKGKYANAPSVSNMDTLPFPDYDDFFAQLESSNLVDETHKPQLLFETSRGCWWGERNHCTFCGLNGDNIAYRSKSAGRAMEELLYLTEKYPNCSVEVVDNILDLKYFKEFIPKLAAHQLDVGLFYEVKANLRKEQIRSLRDAKIDGIQPGIESLSSRVLELMRKGIKGIQNIQLLKWCKELGVRPSWNMLWGFPGEPPDEYARMAELIPLITHLQPPDATFPIRIDRFSPYFDKPAHYGFANIKPYPSYQYIYPLKEEVVANLAYYFTFEYIEPQNVAAYTQPVAQQIALWQKVHKTSDLLSVDKGKYLLLIDLRPIAQQPQVILTGIERLLYIACDRIHTTSQLQHLLKQDLNQELSSPEIEEILQRLVNQGLMIKEDHLYLNLAIPLGGDYSPSQQVLEKFMSISRKL